ncbi:hypothetical protein HDV05_006108 [Chytridiales sp. JEL 0842]|nr:hypothetical protein HDV05_006108 [Chytridiales sp. JEL 0842]
MVADIDFVAVSLFSDALKKKDDSFIKSSSYLKISPPGTPPVLSATRMMMMDHTSHPNSHHTTPHIHRHSILEDVQMGKLNTGQWKRLMFSKAMVARLQVQKPTLKGHHGCVNSLAWNASGTRLLSGSGKTLILQLMRRRAIWDPYGADGKFLLESFKSGHQANIFSAKFMPNSSDRKIVSCAANGAVRFMDVSDASPDHQHPNFNGLFKCHGGMAYEVLPDPINPNVFFSCADDGTVNQYDLRIRTSCPCDGCTQHTLIDVNRSPNAPATALGNSKTLPTSTRRRPSGLMSLFDIPSGVGVSAISIHPIDPIFLALGCLDGVVRIYDRRYIRPPGWGWGSEGEGKSNIVRRGEVYGFRAGTLGHSEEEENEDVVEDDSDEGEIRRRRRRRRRVASYHKITSLKYDPVTGNELLVSYSGEDCYLIRPNEGSGMQPVVLKTSGNDMQVDGGAMECGNPERDDYWDSFRILPDKRDSDIVQSYTGHKNVRTMIKEAYFYGPNSEYIMSGSDDGSLFVWSKDKAELVCKLGGDRHVVNCIAPNPHDALLAVSGIDHDIKVIAPTAEQPWSLHAATAKAETEADEDDEDDVDTDSEELAAFVDGIPRPLLLLYLARMGVTLEEL